jgi:hypothetical protein
MSKKLLNFIKKVRKNDIYNKDRYTSVIDKYTNGECALLVGYLFEENNSEGKHVDIDIIPYNEDGEEDYDSRIYHSVFFFEDYYYDINGRNKTIDELILKLPYYDKDNMILSISEWDIEPDNNYYEAIPERIKTPIKPSRQNLINKN